MPRKKPSTIDTQPPATSDVAKVGTPAATSVAELPKHDAAQPEQSQPHQVAPQASEPEQKQWANSYASIFSSGTRGFEMGEDRRFKQRVFKFSEKPEQAIIDTLKEHGFTYRPNEKAWTIPASPVTRQLTERLAREFAAGTQVQSR